MSEAAPSSSFSSAKGSPLPRVFGRLFFAGEHCAFDTQGFMEGGCESGETAAQSILRSLGRNVPDAKAASGLRTRWNRQRAIA